MALASCLVQLATMVVSFSGQNSFVNITSSASNVSSMVIQFKTTDPNSQIAIMTSGSESFALNVRSGTLKLEYSFNQIGNGSFDLGVVNTNRWFLLNITSPPNQSTRILLHESETSITRSCAAKVTFTRNISLLGQYFSQLLKHGLIIGAPTSNGLKSFKGCIGWFSLDSVNLDLLNTSKNSQLFATNILGTLSGCHCGDSPCINGSYLWDRTKGKCDCKCRLGFNGNLCQNQTITGVSDDDDVDSEFIYIVVGATVGVLVLVTLIICVVSYVKRTNSSAFGVYNPKSQEQTQGQQMNTAFTLPVPEKLI